ncbi:MAG: hypothetical protein AABZ30_08920 [Myxococcota bacterium]
MLDPWIIEEIRRQEEEKLRREAEQQPVLEIVEDAYRPSDRPRRDEKKKSEKRGVIIVDFGA